MNRLLKKNFKSSSAVVIPAIPNFSTSTFATFGERNPGKVGPRWMFFTPRASRVSRDFRAPKAPTDEE